MTTAVPASDRGSARPRRPRWLVLLAVLVVVALGSAVTAVVATRDDKPANASSAAQLSQVQASCADWMAASQARGPFDDRWCTDMFAWMSDQSGGSMMGSMMWQGSERLGTACRAWVSQDRAESGAVGQERCQDMVEWMEGHMSSRGDQWMMPSH
jgi:hypothetical protein